MRICEYATGIILLSACVGSSYADDTSGMPANVTHLQPVGPGQHPTVGVPEAAAPAAATVVPQPTNVGAVDGTAPPAATVAPAVAPATQPADLQTTTTAKGTSVSADQVNVNDSGLVEIHVNDANLVEVLRMLSLQSQKNIIASKDVTGTITANLYDVTVQEALDEILKANGYRYREHGNFIEVYSEKEYADMEKSERKLQTQIFRVHYTPAANIVNMLKPALSPEGQVAFSTPSVTGIDTTGNASGNTGGDSHATEDTLVVTDYPDNLQKIAKIIEEVDRRPDQILIEATILETTLTDNNSLGINFSAMDGVNFSTLQNVSGALGTTPLGALSGAILNSTGSSGGSSGGTSGTGTSGGSTGITPGSLAAKNYGGATTGFPLPSGGLNVGFVTNNLGIFLSALESATNTTVVANPKLLVLNKQQGTVLVGSELGYLTTTNTETTSSQTVNYLDTGVKLIVRPYVGNDGFIRMEIHPEDSSGALDSNGVPSKTTTEVTSNVMVKDGHTIVIGGLFRDASTVSRSQIPILGDLPLIGILFRSKTETTTRQEITVLLTPHVIHDDKAYSESSADELAQAEKMRVGVRKGMMFSGRERLAEGEYEQAMRELRKPEPDRHKVLWHLNAATDLNPTFSEAINLKETITGKVITDSDNSTLRSFVQRQIMEEEANPTTRPSVPWQVAVTVETPAPSQPAPSPRAATQPTAALSTKDLTAK